MRVIVAVMICVAPLLSYSQAKYFVHLVKGSPQWITSGGAKKAVSQKSMLLPGDAIKLNGSGDEVMVIDEQSNIFTIKGKGLRKVNDFKTMTPKRSTGITKKYFELVWEELIHAHADPYKFSVENIAGSLGGVSRDNGSITISSPWNGAILDDDTLTFAWSYLADQPKEVKVCFYTSEGEELLCEYITDTILKLQTAPFFKKGEAYAWSILDPLKNSEPPAKFSFSLLEHQDYKKLVDAVVKQVPEYDSELLQELEIAEAFRQNKLFSEALKKIALIIKNTQ